MTWRRCCVFVSVVAVSGLSIAEGQEKEPAGKAPYDRVCRVCHGPEAKGNQGPALVPFTMEVDELLIRVREGSGEMPPISVNRLSDDEVKEIAAYLKALSSSHNATDKPAR